MSCTGKDKIELEKTAKAMFEYETGLVVKAKAVVDENPYLLRAFLDYMDIHHDRVDPILEGKWEHNAMWLVHNTFMKKANELKAKHLNTPLRVDLDELTDQMKNIACLVDLALLPKEIRDEVEEWAKRYKQAFGKKGEEKQ